MKTRLACFLVVLLALAPALKAEDLSSFEPILVPVYALALRGAGESIWSTEFTVHNGSGRSVRFFPAYAGLAGPFVAVLQPSQVQTPILQRLLSANRLVPRVLPKLIFVERDAAESISFSLRVSNSKQLANSIGTEIPVIRLREFKSGSVQLLNVPLTPGFRTMLRIYSIEHDPSAEFDVRGYDMRTNQLLFELLVTLEIRANDFDPSFADFAEIPITPALVPFRDDLRARIEIEADSPRRQYWSFISVTSESQVVTTVSPQ